MKIQIVMSPEELKTPVWYNEYIGDIFKVVRETGKFWLVEGGVNGCYVLKEHAAILEGWEPKQGEEIYVKYYWSAPAETEWRKRIFVLKYKDFFMCEAKNGHCGEERILEGWYYARPNDKTISKNIEMSISELEKILGVDSLKITNEK